MKALIIGALLLTAAVFSRAQDTLTITQDSVVVDGGLYEKIEVMSVKHITIRNCTVRNATGTNHYAGILLKGTKYVTVENVEVDGGAAAGRGKGTCGGIKLDGASRVTVRNCIIHNLNDDGLRLYQATLVDVIANRVYDLYSCGTDDGCSACNNGHSDGIQIMGCTKVNVIGNIFYNVPYSTSAIGPGDGVDYLFANNIVQWPGAYYPLYLMGFQRCKVYNNVFWAARHWCTVWFEHNLTDLEFRNNIVKGMGLVHGAVYDPLEHAIENNLFFREFNYGTNNLQGVDPQFKGITDATVEWDMDVSAFELKSTSPCINAGYEGPEVPATDFYGKGRNGRPDMGPLEFGGVTGFEHFLCNVPGRTLDITVSPCPMREQVSFNGADLIHGEIGLEIYNSRGQKVHRFKGKGREPCYTWEGKDGQGKTVKPGIYYYSLQVDDMVKTGRIIKVR